MIHSKNLQSKLTPYSDSTMVPPGLKKQANISKKTCTFTPELIKQAAQPTYTYMSTQKKSVKAKVPISVNVRFPVSRKMETANYAEKMIDEDMSWNFVYSPETVASHIRLQYTDKVSNVMYLPNNHVAVISKDYFQNVFYIVSKANNDGYIFYYRNEKWKDNDIALLFAVKNSNINKNMKYGYGYLVGNKLFFINMVGDDGMVLEINEYDQCLNGNMNNYIVTSNTNMILINSSDIADLIFFIMKTTTNIDSIRKLTDQLVSKKYYVNTHKPFLRFGLLFENILVQPPIQNYSYVYDIFSKCNTEYFNYKMPTFQKNLKDLGESFKLIYREENKQGMSAFIANFIDNAKKSISYELTLIIIRYKKKPRERRLLFNRYPDHPYINLLKIVYNKIKLMNLGDNAKGLYVAIINIIGSDRKDTVFDDLMLTMMNALARRSEILCDAFKIYLLSEPESIQSSVITEPVNINSINTLKPNPQAISKYVGPKTYASDYYPFKIFSVKLFYLEHILKLNTQI